MYIFNPADICLLTIHCIVDYSRERTVENGEYLKYMISIYVCLWGKPPIHITKVWKFGTKLVICLFPNTILTVQILFAKLVGQYIGREGARCEIRP